MGSEMDALARHLDQVGEAVRAGEEGEEVDGELAFLFSALLSLLFTRRNTPWLYLTDTFSTCSSLLVSQS